MIAKKTQVLAKKKGRGGAVPPPESASEDTHKYAEHHQLETNLFKVVDNITRIP